MNNNYKLIVVLFIAILFGGIYFSRARVRDLDIQVIPTLFIGTFATTTNIARPDGWIEYTNNDFNFSLVYPDDIKVDEYKESNGAITITFQNEEKLIGFQIFIVPYAESQISEERYQQDVISGVRKNIKNITIGDTDAIIFESEDDFLGETYEVWFIKNGLLYEVTTLKSLDSWLDTILQTWIFIE